MSGVLIPPPVFVDSNNVEELGRFIRVGILVEHYPYWSSGWVYSLQAVKGLFDHFYLQGLSSTAVLDRPRENVNSFKPEGSHVNGTLYYY